MKPIQVLQKPGFKRAYKLLHSNQKLAVNHAVEAIVKDPLLGELKKGDLADVYVYKFKCVNQEYLLAYEFDNKHRLLLALGVHENFYRDLKKKK